MRKLIFFVLRLISRFWLIEKNTPIVIPDRLKDLKIDYLDEGGMLTHFPNAKKPFPGLPLRENLERVKIIKAMFPIVLSTIYKQLKPHLPDTPHYYSRAVREIYRLFTLAMERDLPGMKERWRMIREIVCFFLEYDDAYRFRVQDILSELNKKQIKLDEIDQYWFSGKLYKFGGVEHKPGVIIEKTKT